MYNLSQKAGNRISACPQMTQVWYIVFIFSEIEHVFQKYVKWLPSAVAKPDNFNDLVFSVLLYLMEAVDPEKLSY